jgi:chorismate-pyruvate lyase
VLPKLKRRRDAAGDETGLVGRYFAMQEERPEQLHEVAIDALDPFLRGLLFTEGTVTRALSAQVLAPVAVEPLSQATAALPGEVAGWLELPAGEEAVRRQVSIGVGEPTIPVLSAESFLVPDRLPPGFLGLLDAAPDGLGQLLQRFSLESSRELCWFGLDEAPAWAPRAGRPTLQRLYRIVSGGQPAILIGEHFEVEEHRGTYHLAGLLTHRFRRQREALR